MSNSLLRIRRDRWPTLCKSKWERQNTYDSRWRLYGYVLSKCYAIQLYDSPKYTKSNGSALILLFFFLLFLHFEGYSPVANAFQRCISRTTCTRNGQHVVVMLLYDRYCYVILMCMCELRRVFEPVVALPPKIPVWSSLVFSTDRTTEWPYRNPIPLVCIDTHTRGREERIITII